ncbi:DUF916 domain-containing protein [Actinoplanes sichuanensis]|uniref:DUF916 domain-containing protein n=1 Tax=Actinoplanes sichuanensis TaxID=512349 RepID=A0ABW4A6V3_9ACTN|nr:hypothetical protein [Actinoplanes sichuanensis]BEL03413.1 DUF916 domain-containing protein [Actinoplanes sichuanensis]
MRRAVAVLAALAVLLPAAPAAAAPTSVTWTVQPASAAGPDGRRWIERTLDPGRRITEHLAVRNLGDTSAVFALSAADGYLTAKGRFNMLPSDQKSVGGGTWVSVPESVTVGAGKTVVVPFSITAPVGITPGDHPAGIAASIAGRQGTVQIESRVGFRLLLRASGTLRPSVTADEINMRYAGTWNPFQPGAVEVSYTSANTGNVRLEVPGTAAVSSPAGTRTVQVTAGELLPGGTRSVSTRIDGVWGLGRLRTTVTLTPAGAPPATATLTTWVMPWPQLLVVVAAALLIAAWRLRRRHLRSMLARAREEGRRSATR